MPSKKSARKSEKRRLRNRNTRSTTRTIIGKALDAVREGDSEAAEPAVSHAIRILDRAVTKGLVHKNNAARRKSRLMAKLNKIKTPEAA